MIASPSPGQPIPHWSLSGTWEAIDEATGQPAAWPPGWDPADLPRPRCRLRDRVAFVWRGRRRTGEVRDIRVRLMAAGQPALEYVIYTSGHGFWVPDDQLD